MMEKLENFCKFIARPVVWLANVMECAFCWTPDLQIHRAITNNFAWGVRLAIRRGAKLRDEGWPYHSHIDTAISLQKWDMAHLLLELGADPNPHPLKYNLAINDVPLLSVLYSGQEKLAEAMLERGANINGPRLGGCQQETLLENVMRADKPDAIRFLVRHGASIESGRPQYRPHPLEDAVYMGKTNAVKAFLDAGADPNIPFTGKLGRHLLLVACRMERDDLVEAAVAAPGIQLAPKDYDGNTPLHYAARSDKPILCSRLLRAGGDDMLHSANNLGDTPLHHAMRPPILADASKMLEVLVDAGADINARNRCGETPLMIAIRSDRETSVALLLDLGTDVSIPDHAGRLPLDSTQNPDIKQLLINHAEKPKTHPGIPATLRARLRNRQPVPSL